MQSARLPGRLTAAQVVAHILVQDANDNAPRFWGAPYYALVNASVQRGDVVAKVGLFSPIFYFLLKKKIE